MTDDRQKETTENPKERRIENVTGSPIREEFLRTIAAAADGVTRARRADIVTLRIGDPTGAPLTRDLIIQRPYIVA